MRRHIFHLIGALACACMSLGAFAQQPPDNGRLLASNCFQCHGTNGVNGGFGTLAGNSQEDMLHKLDEMRRKPAGSNIMTAHARGYTNNDLYWITYYFSRQPKP